MKAYLFDIDGTVADLTHRLHHIQGDGLKDWDSFFAACGDDAPIPHMCELARVLVGYNDDNIGKVLFVSGRSEAVRTETLIWLDKYVLYTPSQFLYMRPAGDHRPDNIVKRELLARIRADGYEPIMAFDDRDQVVAMWREAGIPCAQVAQGAF